MLAHILQAPYVCHKSNVLRQTYKPMKVTAEQRTTDLELMKLGKIHDYMKVTEVKDIRDHVAKVREVMGEWYVVGTGGNHIWIHRKDYNTLQPKKERLAIITKN